MVAVISELITGNGLSIETMNTDLRLGKNGRRDFVVNADFTSPVALDQDELKAIVDDISTLKNSLGLDVVDVRVHRAKPPIE
jgi:glycine cleavage system regulatory protein